MLKNSYKTGWAVGIGSSAVLGSIYQQSLTCHKFDVHRFHSASDA
jgi:hypothetical protein